MLSPAESSYSVAEKNAAASDLLVSPEYLQLINQTNEHIDRAVQAVSNATSQALLVQSATLRKYQILQWVLTLTIIFILSIICVMLFVLLLAPLERSAEDVQRGETIPDDRGLAEFRRLAIAYNELLHHRKMMENYLRQQSQTDALTGLPNRLAFQNFISQISWENAHSSVIVFSLDVNGLKETNDHKGHAFGDALLRNCAACIQSALGDGQGKQVFRFGGDEFAAFWVDVPVSELDGALDRFVREQAKHDVSISVGCAYAEDLSETTVDKLFEEADQNMYDEKAEYHRKQAQAVLDQLKLDL
jgi:diguanylate cyclase (GGDEF)-like protein